MSRDRTILKTLLPLFILVLWIGCAQKDGIFQPELNYDASADKVVLLHGLIRSSASMIWIAERLESAGYSVVNLNYSARHGKVDQMVDELHRKLQTCCLDDPGELHFVTHSLGGVVLREYIAQHRPSHLGRVVMLSPPNRGTELADHFGDNMLVGLVFGPVVAELGTDANSAPNQMGSVDFELGIITGDRSWNPIASWMIPGPDDGTVSVQRAQVDGMKSFLVVPRTHTFIMNSDQVINEVLYFLEHGDFSSIDSQSLDNDGNP